MGKGTHTSTYTRHKRLSDGYLSHTFFTTPTIKILIKYFVTLSRTLERDRERGRGKKEEKRKTGGGGRGEGGGPTNLKGGPFKSTVHYVGTPL